MENDSECKYYKAVSASTGKFFTLLLTNFAKMEKLCVKNLKFGLINPKLGLLALLLGRLAH